MSFEEEQRTVRRELDSEIKEKDGEIERLKAENDMLIEQFKALREICYSKDALLAECGDALESIPATAHWDWSVKLIQRVREASK